MYRWKSNCSYCRAGPPNQWNICRSWLTKSSLIQWAYSIDLLLHFSHWIECMNQTLKLRHLWSWQDFSTAPRGHVRSHSGREVQARQTQGVGISARIPPVVLPSPTIRNARARRFFPRGHPALPLDEASPLAPLTEAEHREGLVF